MGEATINPKQYVQLLPYLLTFPTAFFTLRLEDALRKALPTLFPHLLRTTNSAPIEFYDKFQREADEYDRDFVKKYSEDLDTTLIFVGFLFFARLIHGVHLDLLGE